MPTQNEAAGVKIGAASNCKILNQRVFESLTAEIISLFFLSLALNELELICLH
jgi:hypothetical protein